MKLINVSCDASDRGKKHRRFDEKVPCCTSFSANGFRRTHQFHLGVEEVFMYLCGAEIDRNT